MPRGGPPEQWEEPVGLAPCEGRRLAVQGPVAAVEHIIAPGGQRLDKVLAALPSVGSRERARAAVRSGKVHIGGQAVEERDAALVLAEGVRVELRWNEPGTASKRAAGRGAERDVGVRVVFRDAAILVCDKEPGLLTDAADDRQGRNEDTLRKRVAALLGHDAAPAHRIDRWTTGLVCFARTRAAHENLAAQWADHAPLRRYLCLVDGGPKADEGQFADWMRWDDRELLQKPCRANDRGAVLARARWAVVERFPAPATLLEVRLHTGRRNQIRLHADLAGFPLVGERLYRSGPTIVPWTRYALHAAELGFRHPETQEPLRFTAPLPTDVEDLLRRLRGPRTAVNTPR